MKLRNYQEELADRGKLLLLKNNILYLAMEMRVGKTLISMQIAKLIKAKSVLFVTTKKAITTIKKDYTETDFKFPIIVTNYESVHKLQNKKFDLVICDEAHGLGSFPKPNKRVKQLQKILSDNQARLILLSGTPTPESYSQLYHQLYISPFTPFSNWPNFYKWAQAGFVNIYQVRISGFMINKYDKANKNSIDKYTKHLFLTYTQEQAGFEVTELKDKIILIDVDKRIHELAKLLIDERLYQFRDGMNLVCDTAAKLQQKLHQIYSGTIIVDDDGERTSKVLDTSKADYILKNYVGKKKIAIFYLYDQEGKLLKEKIKNWTQDPLRFASDKSLVFISQFQSGARAINLSVAEVIIFYNIHFSSELYQQARQRGQEKNKKTKTELHWLFSKGGIEEKIYPRVINKQSYTLSYFREDFL